MTTVEGMLQAAGTLVKHWWALVLRGVVAILFGILVLAAPVIGLRFLIAAWGGFAILSGVFAIAAAVRAGEHHRAWGAMVLEGLLGLAAGVFTFVWPGLTALTLTYLIGFWAIGTGITELVAAVRLRHELPDEWILGLDGVLTIAFGVIALLRPRAGALALATVFGFYAIFFGVTQAALGVRLGRLRSRLSAPTVPSRP